MVVVAMVVVAAAVLLCCYACLVPQCVWNCKSLGGGLDFRIVTGLI